jgi:hypothetical protein
MKEKLETIETVAGVDCKIEDYSYQDLLTPELDNLADDFNQDIINEIVLWKVNRYALIEPETLALLNKIKKEDHGLDKELTREILFNLLSKGHKGIRLAMASTILRFKNPNIYQILDQRVYRFIFGKELKYSLTNIEEQIGTYFEYLDKLNKVCKQKKIDFREADRILYMMDKKHNSGKKISY